jgi:hypothetical protein
MSLTSHNTRAFNIAVGRLKHNVHNVEIAGMQHAGVSTPSGVFYAIDGPRGASDPIEALRHERSGFRSYLTT